MLILIYGHYLPCVSALSPRLKVRMMTFSAAWKPRSVRALRTADRKTSFKTPPVLARGVFRVECSRGLGAHVMGSKAAIQSC